MPSPTPITSISVYCGARPGTDPRHLKTGQELGRACAQRGIRVVYGGSRAGIMGAVADAALAAGGEVTGVIPRQLLRAEIRHEGVTDMRSVLNMHERKQVFTEQADAFIVLPGGIGTLDELFEAWTWGHLGIHDKCIGILDTTGYFDGLRTFLERGRDEGFIDPDAFGRLLWGDSTDGLLDAIAAWSPGPPPAFRAHWDRR